MNPDTTLTGQAHAASPTPSTCAGCGATLAHLWTRCGMCGHRRRSDRCSVCGDLKGDAGHWLKWGASACPPSRSKPTDNH